MIVDVLGIVESGNIRSAKLPQTTAQRIAVPIGEDVTVRVTVVMSDGSPRALGVGEAVALTIRKTSTTRPLISVSATSPITGGASNRFALAFGLPEEKAAQFAYAPGRYVYDVWITKTVGGVVVPSLRIVVMSPFVFQPSAYPAVN